MRRLWLLPLALLLAPAALVLWGAWRWVTPRREGPPPDPEGARAEPVTFPSGDGTPLYGAWLPGRPDYPVVVLCHGYFKSLAEPWEVGRWLQEAGYNALLFDFRGCGRSGGRFTTLGYKETGDVLAAVGVARRRFPRAPIAVYGISMGAAAAIMAAARCREIAAVAADSPYAHLEGLIRHKVRDFVPWRWLVPLGWLSVRLGLLLAGGSLDRVRPVDQVGRISPRPLLLIYGERDSYIPPEQPHELFRAAGEPREMWIAPGSDHAVARFDHPLEYWRRLRSFFDRHLLGAGGATEGGPGPP